MLAINSVIQPVPKANGQPNLYVVDQRGVVVCGSAHRLAAEVELPEAELAALVARATAKPWIATGSD